MKPHPDLIKILNEHKCKVMYKVVDKDHFLISVDYNETVKPKKGDGLDVWGRKQETFENINITLRRYHPSAVLESQNGVNSAMWRVGGQSFNK
jgi:hypothetical protein